MKYHHTTPLSVFFLLFAVIIGISCCIVGLYSLFALGLKDGILISALLVLAGVALTVGSIDAWRKTY